MANSISGAALAVLIMNLLAKILGFVREMLMARVFGANMYTDAYVTAYTIPYFVQSILGAALVTVTVPILTKYLVEKNREEASLVTDYFINFTGLIMFVFCAAGLLAAPLLVKMTAPWYDAETAQLAVELTRIIFPTVIFMAIGQVLAGVLNANRRFLAPAFAPGFCSIIIILVLLTVGDHYGIHGLAFATVLGFIAYFLLLVVPSLRVGYRYRPRVSLHHPDVRAALAMVIPIVVGTSVNQIYYILNRFFASGLAEGSITALNYASKLINFPNGVFVAAIAVAVYPSFTEFALKGERERLGRSLQSGMGAVMLMTVPAAVGMMVLRVPIVQLLFEDGAFTAAHTLLTSSAVFWYALGLFPLAAVLVLLKVFYAFGDVKTPIYAAIAAIAVNIAVSLLTIGSMAHDGLALANSVAAFANMFFFYAMLKRYLPGHRLWPYFCSFLRILAAALLMAAAVYGTELLLRGSTPFVVVAAGLCVGIVVYLGIACVARFPEMVFIVDKLKSKLRH